MTKTNEPELTFRKFIMLGFWEAVRLITIIWQAVGIVCLTIAYAALWLAGIVLLFMLPPVGGLILLGLVMAWDELR